MVTLQKTLTMQKDARDAEVITTLETVTLLSLVEQTSTKITALHITIVQKNKEGKATFCCVVICKGNQHDTLYQSRGKSAKNCDRRPTK